ncbi:MAG: hypothetical protein M1828_006434 [Chrysothrix sp. TS-e1954]|nr:MAG: hypothetical protein M1828_006434 [Chrysothrix sp. TS-e1954]
MEPDNNSPFRLLALPQELRNCVYDHVLELEVDPPDIDTVAEQAKATGLEPGRESQANRARLPQYYVARPSAIVHPYANLVLCSRQIRSEVVERLKLRQTRATLEQKLDVAVGFGDWTVVLTWLSPPAPLKSCTTLQINIRGYETWNKQDRDVWETVAPVPIYESGTIQTDDKLRSDIIWRVEMSRVHFSGLAVPLIQAFKALNLYQPTLGYVPDVLKINLFTFKTWALVCRSDGDRGPMTWTYAGHVCDTWNTTGRELYRWTKRTDCSPLPPIFSLVGKRNFHPWEQNNQNDLDPPQRPQAAVDQFAWMFSYYQAPSILRLETPLEGVQYTYEDLRPWGEQSKGPLRSWFKTPSQGGAGRG